MGFFISYGCMVGNVGEGQTNQSVVGISTCDIYIIRIIDEIDSLRCTPMVHRLFISFLNFFEPLGIGG